MREQPPVPAPRLPFGASSRRPQSVSASPSPPPPSPPIKEFLAAIKELPAAIKEVLGIEAALGIMSRACEPARVTAPRALVVGGSSAIGTAIATALADLGHEVVLWGRDPQRLAAAAAACGAAGVDALDVTDADAVRATLDRLLAAGGLDVVVWAAGVFDWAPAHEADPARWANLLDVNLTAAAVLTAMVLPALVERAPSALVYVGSGAARRAYPFNAAYVASKHGLAGLAHGTFLDVRDRGVKVSLVSPGLVAAGAGLLSPAGQERPGDLLTPDDVAAAVRFVVTFPATGCPVEIDLQPQHST
jgi:NADP-dependent 3-hydroxy acid dehydrogenase YdfG